MSIKSKYNYSAKQYLLFFVTACVFTLIAFVITTRNGDANAVPASTAVQTESEPAKATDISPELTSSVFSTDKEKEETEDECSSSKSGSSKSENTSSKNSSSKTESSSSKNNSSKSENTTSEKSQGDTDKTENKSDSSKKSSDSDKTESKTEAVAKTKIPPKEYHIDVEHILQNEVMPTGCEIVSTKMVLDYYGMDRLSLDDMLDHLECSELKFSKDGKLYGLSPFQAFIGNPKKSNGFGCYPPVIMDMIEDFDFGALYAEDTSSLPFDFLAETYVPQDIPVLVWVTIGMCDSYLTDSWYLCDDNGKITKKKYTWRAEEHCMVLIGYDKKYYYFCDPLSEKDVVKYEKSLVEKRYKEIGSYSMIIRKGTFLQ